MSAFEFAKSRLACLFLGHRVDPLASKLDDDSAQGGILHLRLQCWRCGEEGGMLPNETLGEAMGRGTRWATNPHKVPL